MKEKETRERVVQKVTVITKRTCDVCQRECPDPEDGNWSKETYIQERASLEHSYYCDGDLDAESIDICPECAKWIMKNIGKIRILQQEKGGE